MAVSGYTIWALNDRVKRWLPLEVAMPGHKATAELAQRQDRIRRNGYNTRFRVLPDGQHPDDPKT